MEKGNKNVFGSVESVESEYLKADERFYELLKDGKYKNVLNHLIGLGNYSLRTIMLILQQKPHAIEVNTMRGWNYAKRSILPGEKAIKIYAPIFDSTVTMDDNGNYTEKQLNTVKAYEPRNLFDISQTSGEQFKSTRLTTDDFEKEFETVVKALEGTAKGYEFKVGDIEGYGIMDTASKTITIKSGLDKPSHIKALISQIAAVNVLTRNRINFDGIKVYNIQNINAVEMSAINYIVSNRFGLMRDNLIELDFKNMSEDNLSRFCHNIGIIRSVSQRMIDSAENAVSYSKHLAKVRTEIEAGDVKTMIDTQAEQSIAVATSFEANKGRVTKGKKAEVM